MEQATSLLLFLLFFILFLILKQIILPPKSKPPTSTIPSASPLPILAHIFLRRHSILELGPLLRRLHALHGPIFSLRLFPLSNPSIFISSSSLSHSSLVLKGAAFANRPAAIREPDLLLTANRHNISTSRGSLWRLLRRNLSSETLHQSRLRLFAPARRSALRDLVDGLLSQSSGAAILVKPSFQHAISALLVLMCFGEKLGAGEIRDIETDMEFLLRLFTSFNYFAFFPAAAKVLFRKRWAEIVGCRRRQAETFLPMIRAREQRKPDGGFEFCHVDSLLGVRIPEEGGRGLTDDEMVVLCQEFLGAGIDTTTTALEWTMAELTRNQGVQGKLWAEISSFVENDKKEIFMEEDLANMPYLKAVVMESLRRHPPGQYLLPHSVAEDATVGGFRIPAGTEVNFAVADVNWDGGNWEEPMEFRPERFMEGGDGEGVDISGRREIKMMTFGAGRRICPGYGLAMLHLEFFVANLVREFEWKVEEEGGGGEVDLSERLEFTTVMKNPLRARLIPRSKK